MPVTGGHPGKRILQRKHLPILGGFVPGIDGAGKKAVKHAVIAINPVLEGQYIAVTAVKIGDVPSAAASLVSVRSQMKVSAPASPLSLTCASSVTELTQKRSSPAPPCISREALPDYAHFFVSYVTNWKEERVGFKTSGM